MEKDKNLLGNKRIENAITDMYQKLNDERLAKVLYVIRDRVHENGHLVVAVKPGSSSLELRTVSTPDGKRWFRLIDSV